MNVALLLELITDMHPTRGGLSFGSETLTYEELLQRAHKWSAAIHRAPTGPVMYVGGTKTRFVEMLFGTALAGRDFVPVNFRSSEREFEHFLAIAEPGLVACDARYRDTLQGLIASMGGPTRLIDEDYVPESDLQPPADVQRTPAVLLFTSGTTSAPKLVRLEHRSLSSYLLETVPAGSASPAEAMLVSAPPYHIAAVMNVLSSTYRGRRVVLMAQFDARRWLELVRDQAITHAMVVPTMLSRILDVLDDHPELMPTSLESLSYGGSRAPGDLIERALATLPTSVGFVNAYGLTETSSTISLLGPEDHRLAWESDSPDVRRRLKSAGRPIPGVEIAIRDEAGTDLLPLGEGAIWIRGPQLASGYQGTAMVLDDEGWWRSGDRGFRDEEGYLFVLGREDDTIVRGGENISAGEVEDAIHEHPAVTDASVVGLEDEEWGEILGALVVGDDRATSPEELSAWLRNRIAGYKVPTVIKWIPELPRNEMGKVIRREAVALLQAPEERT